MSFPKQQFHVEPEKGWLNDPNGLCWFGGKYHAYYQHNPTATVWTACPPLLGTRHQRRLGPLGGPAHRPLPRYAL